MLYTLYVTKMMGGDNDSYYVLKMSNLCKNYVWQAGDVYPWNLYEEGHGKDTGHSLDGLYDQVQKDEEQEVDSHVVVSHS